MVLIEKVAPESDQDGINAFDATLTRKNPPSSAQQNKIRFTRQISDAFADSNFFDRIELYGTAALSISDMGTDIMMAIRYMNGGKLGPAYATICW